MTSPARGDIAAAAAESALAGQILGFVRWAGDGRRLTQTGEGGWPVSALQPAGVFYLLMADDALTVGYGLAAISAAMAGDESPMVARRAYFSRSGPEPPSRRGSDRPSRR